MSCVNRLLTIPKSRSNPCLTADSVVASGARSGPRNGTDATSAPTAAPSAMPSIMCLFALIKSAIAVTTIFPTETTSPAIGFVKSQMDLSRVSTSVGIPFSEPHTKNSSKEDSPVSAFRRLSSKVPHYYPYDYLAYLSAPISTALESTYTIEPRGGDNLMSPDISPSLSPSYPRPFEHKQEPYPTHCRVTFQHCSPVLKQCFKQRMQVLA